MTRTAQEHLEVAEALIDLAHESAAGTNEGRLRLAELHIGLANAIKTHAAVDEQIAVQRRALDVMEEETDK